MNSRPQALPLLLLLLAPVLLLDGCTTTASTEAAAEKPVPLEPRAHRENRLQTAWRGRPYKALLEAYGSPKMVMSLPGYRPVKTSVVVFGVIDRASDCIDSFTVVSQGQSEDMTVSDYYCR